MKRLALIVCFLSFGLLTFAQNVDRIKIKGRIIVETNDVEAVTVFNTSSNKGTITDSKGAFEIEVALNDVLEVSALQFEKFTVKIDERILSNKYLTVFLVEKINKLDEVVVMPYDMLTGDLVSDVKTVETFNPDLDAIYFGVNDVYSFEFTDDYKSRPDESVLREGEYYNGFNVLGALSMVLKPVFNHKNKSKKPSQEELYPTISIEQKDLTEVYGREFLTQTFNIPENQLEAFVAFVETDTFDYSLLDTGNEMELIEYLYHQSQVFLKDGTQKD